MAWSDYADWSSADTLKLAAAYDILHPVVEAFNERLEFVKLKQEYTYDSTFYPLSAIDMAQLDVVNGGMLNSIGDKIFQLAFHFASPEYNIIALGMPDSYSNRLYRTLLSLTGEQYIIKTLDAEIPAAWAFQMYKALNLCRYIQTKYLSSTLFGINSVISSRRYLYWWSGDWDSKVIEFKNLPIIEQPYTENSQEQSLLYKSASVYAAYGYTYGTSSAIGATSIKLNLKPLFSTKFYIAKQYGVNQPVPDYWSMGSNHGALFADCPADEAADVSVPYPDIALFPATFAELYPLGGYDSGSFRYFSDVYSYILIDGSSGENGFEFFDDPEEA